MFKPSESEPLKPRSFVVQMKVALQGVESSMENIDRSTSRGTPAACQPAPFRRMSKTIPPLARALGGNT